jgi:hypothetical protein
MDAIGPYEPHPWESTENPQTYDIMKCYGEHPKPTQHTLGLVGGNEVPYETREKQVNIESDLRGITRANTFCPQRQHLPKDDVGKEVKRDTPKQKVSINVSSTALKPSQMWAYPATLAPEPFSINVCNRPEKY